MATAGTIVFELKMAVDIILAEDGNYYIDASTAKGDVVAELDREAPGWNHRMMSSRGVDEAPHTVLELPHGGVLSVASTSLFSGYDDKTLKPLVAVPKKQEIKLILCEPNYGGGMPTRPLVSASKKNPDHSGVEDAERTAFAKEEWIVDIPNPLIDQHCLLVGRSAIEQDFDTAKHIDREWRPFYYLVYKMTSAVFV